MKTFQEYIAEANPVVDKNRRDEALRTFNKMVSALEKLVKSKSTEHMLLDKVGYTTNIAFNLGKFIGDSKYNNLKMLFTPVSKNHGGSYGKILNGPTIELAILTGRSVKNPDGEMLFLDPILPKIDPSNYEQLLKIIKSKKDSIRDIFVHEFIHHTDTLIYKDSNYIDQPSFNAKTGYGKEYYNHPKELNAHTQEMILNMDLWFKEYYVTTVNALKTRMVIEFNQANDEYGYENALFVAAKIVRHHDMIIEYLSDNRKGIESVLEKIPTTKKTFMKNLSDDNRKKVLSRLYQYYSETLTKRFNVLKQSLILVKKLNNKNAIAYIQKEVPDLYKSLVQMD